MFDIGMAELLLMAALAIMLYGGELPDVARKAGQTMRRLRGAADDLKRQMTAAGADPELHQLARDIDPRRELPPPPPPPPEPPVP